MFVNSLTGFYVHGAIVFKILWDHHQFLLLMLGEFKRNKLTSILPEIIRELQVSDSFKENIS